MREIADAVLEVEKKYGKGVVCRLGDSKKTFQIDTFSSGSLRLDEALGGGYPIGRIIEVYGPESSGKTTLALHAIAEMQRKGGKALFIDAEHALDVEYAKALGVDTDDLILSQPDYGEQALDIAHMLVESGGFGLVVVDSVAALIPKKELDGDIGDSHVGLQARLMSQAMRKLASIANQNNCTMIFINQIRLKIGVMFGSPETTSGGQALKFYASVRIDVRRRQSLKGADKGAVGNETHIKIVKNKIAPPFKTATVDIVYGEGISRLRETLSLGVDLDIVEKKGGNHYFKGERLGTSHATTVSFLEENPKVLEKIRKEIQKPKKKEKTSAPTPSKSKKKIESPD